MENLGWFRNQLTLLHSSKQESINSKARFLNLAENLRHVLSRPARFLLTLAILAGWCLSPGQTHSTIAQPSAPQVADTHEVTHNTLASNADAANTYIIMAGPELDLVKAVMPAEVDPGEAVTYTLTFSNTGDAIATQVVLTDTLPGNIRNSDWHASPGLVVTHTAATRYEWQVQNLSPNEVGVITITGVVSRPLIPQTILNEATIAAIDTTDTASVTLIVRQATPTADAGEDQMVNPNANVTLHGSGEDPNGGSLTYTWIQTGGTPVTLSDVNIPQPTFTAPGAEDVLTFSLSVSNSYGLISAPDETVVTVGNRIPVADAGEDQTVSPGATVVLDGSGSSDSDGDVLTYTWEQIGEPVVTLTGSDQVSATFTAPITDCVLTFTLTVDDGQGGTDSDDVVVAVINQPPVADAGADQYVAPGMMVTLDGSDSTDPEGERLEYGWEQIGGPSTTLSAYDRVTATFLATLPAPKVLTFTLVVTDSQGQASKPDDVMIHIGNRPPVADAGPDQTVNPGESVTLTGMASTDPDGDELTFAWVQSGGVSVTLTSSDTPTPTFTAPTTAPSVLTFTLTVDDGEWSDSDDVVIYVGNRPPLANAGSDQTVNPGESVTLTGMASTDPDGDELTFAWVQSGGVSVTLTSSDTPTPTFTAPITAPSVLTFTLTVDDGYGGIDSDDVVVTVNEADEPYTCYLPLVVKQ